MKSSEQNMDPSNMIVKNITKSGKKFDMSKVVDLDAE